MSDRVFNHDWVTDLVPVWTMLILPLIPKNAVKCLEIGSFEGRSACWILDNIVKNCPESHLDCVDLWPNMDEQERVFDINLSSEPQVTKHKDFSVHFLAPRVAEPPSYDLIYVDGDHRGEVLFTDLALSWRCLKKKGVLVIDDYEYEGPELEGVPKPKIAIDTFLKMYSAELRLLEIGRQVIIQKRAQPLAKRY